MSKSVFSQLCLHCLVSMAANVPFAFYGLDHKGLIHAVLLRTYFNPDEYWQCLEPAHKLAFGYGHRTWEWAAGLRGYLHPVLFALLYKGLQGARLDTIWAVANGPQIMQAISAAVTDVYVYKLALLLYGRNSARWTLLCQLTNWFNAYCLVRIYSNSFEALCTVMGVFYWLASSTTHLSQPVDLTPSTQQAQFQAHTSSSGDAVSQSVNPPHTGKQELAPGLQPKSSSVCQQQRQQQLKQPCSPIRDSVTSIHTSERRLLMTSRQKALWAAAVGVLFRPSSLLFWVPLGMHELRVCRAKWRFILEAALIGGCTLLMGALIDRVGYGRWVLVPWEFAKFNLLQAGSAMYGSHPWHWNFTQGLPTITVTHLPLAVWGVYLSRGRLELAALVLWSLLMYSLPAHKEFRFLLPALLLLMPYCGVALHDLASRWSQHRPTAEALLQKAASCKVQRDKLQPHQMPASKKWAFTPDRSAVDQARQLSRLLEEAPQEGGCPFMVPTDAMPEPSKDRTCPFSSGRAPTAQARETPVHVAEDGTCPLDAANPASVMPAPEGAAAGSCVSSCVQPNVSSHLQQPKAPLHHGQGGSSPVPPLPHPAPDSAAARAKLEQSQSGAMTEEELKEYEQAFAVEPNEAMLQAYAALLADKVTEAEREPDDTPQRDSCAIEEDDWTPDSIAQRDDKSEEDDREVEDTSQRKRSAHRAEQLTQSTPVHPPSPTRMPTDADDALLEAHGGKHSCFSEASPSKVSHSLAQPSSAETTPDAAAAVATAAVASATDSVTANSSRFHTVTVHSKAAVRALCQESHQAYQGSMSRVRWCYNYLQQQPQTWHVLMTICFGVQLAMTLYFSLVHQRGQIDVMHYLAHEAQLQPSMRVLFLTPCHATPWFSHVHANITMDFLDCSPPGWAEATRCLNTPGCSLQGLQSADMQSMPPQHEYGLFTQNPLQFLQSRWDATTKHSMPTHLVMFQDLVPAVSRYIAEQGFALKKTFFNCHVQVDAGGSIWLWKQSA